MNNISIFRNDLEDSVNSDSESSENERFYSPVCSSDESFHSTFIPLNVHLETKFAAFPKDFNVVHLNAQSIPAHFADFLTSFDVTNIHAVLVSETFLKPCLPSTSYSLPGFRLIRNDRVGKGGGGVAIYLRSHIPFSILNKSASVYSESSEHLLLELLFGNRKVLLGVFYSPSLRIDYFQEFETLLENHVPNVDHSIIMGDFNTCLIKDDARAHKLKSIISSLNLTLLQTNATHYFPNCSPSQLDLMIVSAPELVNVYGQLSAEAFSYHDSVYLSYKVRPPKIKPTIVMRRCYKKFDNEIFLQDLNDLPWDTIFDASTIDEKISIFNSLLTELFDIHAPFRPIKLKHLPAPWLTDEIKLIMTKRNTAKSKYKLKPTDANLFRYKRLRNRCNKMCRDAQRKFIHSSVDGKSTLVVWRFLESLGIGRQHKDFTDNVDINALNCHFTNVSSNILNKSHTLSSINSQPSPNFPMFHFNMVTHDEVKKHITAVKSDAMGCDGISRKMILLCLDSILYILCHLFNHSLSTNAFPSVWRIAQVIPIPKISNPTQFSHYRPISILPFLSKVLERIAHAQLSLFFLKNNILSPFQSGFRRGHSTVTALTKVCDDIRSGIDNKQVTILVLLDFSNAFNTVDFEILLAILKSVNISSDAVSWFHSYLYDRLQCIRLKGKLSSYCRLSAGVPQGGVLSPLIFSVFINSVTNLLSLPYHLYADDFQLYVSTPVESIHEAIRHLNHELNVVCDWSKSHGLLVNASKSQVIVVGNSRQISKFNYSSLPPVIFDGSTLTYSDTVKNLGIIMDSNLSWKPQVTAISKKVFSAFGSIKRWKNLLPVKTKTLLANALLLPILDYADTCYLDLTEELLNKLERLQNLCIRFIFGLRKYDHITDYRKKLNWLPIRYRRNLHVLSLLFAVLYHPWSPPYLKERFNFLSSFERNRTLRSSWDNRLKVNISNTQRYSESFTIKATLLWNALPVEIRRSKSLAVFKNRVKKHYLSL